MATVTAFIQHTPIGKSTQAQPYTAAANARYNMREAAMDFFYSENMPRNYHAIQRWLIEREDNLRANGRVQDGLIISIPRDVSKEHAITVLKGLGHAMGKGRVPFYFVGHGFDGQNHHAHFGFYDSDISTGKRVFQTSERGSSHRIKLVWQEVANQAFEEMGYDVRVKVHEGYELQAENDNVQEPAQEPLDERHDVDELTDMENERYGDDGGEDSQPYVTSDLVGVDPVGTIKFIHDVKADLEFLQRSREKLRVATERHAWLVQRRQELSVEASKYHQDSLPKLMNAEMAQRRFAEHSHEDGRLKGAAIEAFGFTLFKSKGRKAAEAAQLEAHNLRIEADQVNYTRRSYETKLDVMAQQAIKAEETAYAHREELQRVYGDDEDMNLREASILKGMAMAALEVTLEQAMEAYEKGAITLHEYRTFLLEAGYDAEVKLLDESVGEDEGQSL